MSMNTERGAWLESVLLAAISVVLVAACGGPEIGSATGGTIRVTNTVAPPQATLPDGFVVDLELALTPEETANGLMFRPSLPENRGMIFIFDQARRPAFWMKNTLIPLDLVFLDGGGTVVDLIADVPPCAADPCPNYPPSQPALAVLEIGAGVAAKHGLEIGSTITFERVAGYPVKGESDSEGPAGE